MRRGAYPHPLSGYPSLPCLPAAARHAVPGRPSRDAAAGTTDLYYWGGGPPTTGRDTRNQGALLLGGLPMLTGSGTPTGAGPPVPPVGGLPGGPAPGLSWSGTGAAHP